ncbi:MAG: hypothetical protein P8K68_07615 [Algibacter sp.]|uniref:hypothetical protein n=1 Tax=Algibacter sp. TaxID=1872428 RepID=UPI00263948D6|nr:hypothetical protein [Algibacter sp.]MDG1729451.1 hypothetical protein [Algibacter sp.]MDG2178637.1 hypothetical protein [Algibacter sp.]
MKRSIILLLVLMFIGCNHQVKEKEVPEIDSYEIAQDHTAVKPKEKWDVRKEYDEFGNLIKYDSIYSWSYSDIKGDSLRVNLDSIMDSFQRYLGDNMPNTWNQDFSYFPKHDSLFMNDFFEDDYFFRNWQNQHSELESMIKHMDSTRNLFLKRFHPGLLESKEMD